MSDATESVITIDAATVAALSPADKTIFILGGVKDTLDFTAPTEWRLTEPIVSSQFVLTITNQLTGEVVQYNSAAPWQNPIQPSDVDNGGDRDDQRRAPHHQRTRTPPVSQTTTVRSHCMIR